MAVCGGIDDPPAFLSPGMPHRAPISRSFHQGSLSSLLQPARSVNTISQHSDPEPPHSLSCHTNVPGSRDTTLSPAHPPEADCALCHSRAGGNPVRRPAASGLSSTAPALTRVITRPERPPPTSGKKLPAPLLRPPIRHRPPSAPGRALANSGTRRDTWGVGNLAHACTRTRRI